MVCVPVCVSTEQMSARPGEDDGLGTVPTEREVVLC